MEQPRPLALHDAGKVVEQLGINVLQGLSVDVSQSIGGGNNSGDLAIPCRQRTDFGSGDVEGLCGTEAVLGLADE